jgi:glycosyltransferase involved in cell wall biosynthesis
MNRVLMVAYHFPPLRGSSGIQRTLRFCRYLPEFGWNPVVLTAHPRAYDDVDMASVREIPAGVPVHRAFALNAARHLSIRGRYPALLALPDRWSSWLAGAVAKGLAVIRKERINVIFSTYPIATAHVVGLALRRLTGLPWIADFRDPMAQNGYPSDPRIHRSFEWIEERTLRHCARALFTSPGAIRDYRQRYPHVPAERYALVENGYDEEVFAAAAANSKESMAGSEHEPRTSGGRVVILHSGIVYPSERDPAPLFAALGKLKRDGVIDARRVEFRFRASGYDALLASLAAHEDIVDLVTLAPPVPYAEAVREMMEVDGLLLMQAANCNSQIPAQAYEYLRAGRPIFALTDPAGDTWDLMRRAGAEASARLDSVPELLRAVRDFIARLQRREARVPDAHFASACSRRTRTRMLAEALDTCLRIPCSGKIARSSDG